MKATKTLTEAIAITAELTGTVMSEPAARVMADELARYPEAQIIAALARCRRELKSRLTIADVVTRIDDGRPGPEQAWAMMPTNEAQSVVWTEEMAHAYGVAAPLLNEGETVQARMAFLETYREATRKARDEGRPVKWTPSLGHDPAGREAVLTEAARLGRLPADHVAGLLPHREQPPEKLAGLLPDMSARRTLKEALEEVKSQKAPMNLSPESFDEAA